MRFEDALNALRAGKRVRRAGWTKNWLHLEILTRGSIDEVYLLTDVGMEWPYTPVSRRDLLQEDWEIVE